MGVGMALVVQMLIFYKIVILHTGSSWSSSLRKIEERLLPVVGGWRGHFEWSRGS